MKRTFVPRTDPERGGMDCEGDTVAKDTSEFSACAVQLGQASTAVLIRPDQLINNSTACEDCPDINPDPPEKSECPYFSRDHGPEPLCTRDDGTRRLFDGSSTPLTER